MIEEQRINPELPIAHQTLDIDAPDNGLPVLPLKNIVVLPTSIIPIIVGRKSSIKAVENALKQHNKTIFVTAQKNPDDEKPSKNDLFEYGTKATILQMMKMPNNSLKILVEGVSRARMIDTYHTSSHTTAIIEEIHTTHTTTTEIEAAWRNLTSAYKAYTKLNTKIPADLVNHVHGLEDKESITDTIAVHANISFEDRQSILETIDLQSRMMLITVLLKKEIDILQTEERIKGRIQTQVEKNQREYYLSEQIKAIHKELGREDHTNEVESLRKKAKQLKLPKTAFEKVEKEINRLEQMPSMSAETTVSKHYIDWMLSLPWHKKSKDNVNLEQAEKILNKDHSGLVKVKERILEFVAAKKFATDLKKSPTICLVGPPGVGKTSLATSIAASLGREFVRIALGGVRDEAEIRGHRRTYIGALPGKIIQSMRKSKTINPIILLDEIDKLTKDVSGDPAAALLEVLDPAQNSTFSDHFIDTEYDLSNVMFITTANSVDTIPYALYDRMEVISIPGYTEQEKVSIAENFLIPKQLKEHSLTKKQIKITADTLLKVIQEYTKEAGVRQLDRLVAKLMRKSIQDLLKSPTKKSVTISEEKMFSWLGSDRFKKTDICQNKNTIGIATGLAWTEVGGDVLEIEVTVHPGKGNFTLTGQLGEVMQESAQAAFSYIKTKATELGIKKSVFNDKDIHIHMPEGATPKDGPSAGIAMCSALISALTDIPFNNKVAMTGEITLRGRVLSIGGLKEKLLAAQQYNIETVILPSSNKPDLKEFEKDISNLNIIFADHMDTVLKNALIKDPFKKKAKPAKRKTVTLATKTRMKSAKKSTNTKRK